MKKILLLGVCMIFLVLPLTEAIVEVGVTGTAVVSSAANPQLTLTTTSADDIVVVQIYIKGGQASSSVSDLTDGGYTLAGGYGSTGTSPRVETWYLNNPTAETKTIFITNSGTSHLLNSFTLRGTRSTSFIGNVTGGTGSGTTINNPITTLYDNSSVISFLGQDRDRTLTEGGGQESIWTATAGGGDKKAAEGTNETVASAGLDTQTWTSSGGDTWAVMSVEFREAVTPTWSNNVSFPSMPTRYNSSQVYEFNVTWANGGDLDEVTIRHNFTTAFTNYTVTTNVGDEYYYNYNPLAAGRYEWRMYANTTSDLEASTPFFTYDILRAFSDVNLTLNETSANITVEAGGYVTINGTKLIGEGVIELLQDGANLTQTGNGPLNLSKQFTTFGVYNITVRHNQTQNYTYNISTYFINVTDFIAPTVNIDSVAPTSAQYARENVTVNVTVFDWNLDTYYINVTYPNGTLLGQFYSNFTMTTDNLSALGIYNVTLFANDTTGNQSITNTTFTVVDIDAPDYSNIEENITDPTTYHPEQQYEFNVTWFDFFAVDEVWLVWDGETFTDITNVSGNYTKVFSELAAGSYTYRWYANDTEGNENNTGPIVYTVNRNQSVVDLTINGNDADVLVNESTLVQFNGTANNPSGGFLRMYKNGSLMYNGTSVISYNETTAVGYYNITLIYNTTQNYSGSSETHYLRVNAYPNVTLELPTDGFTDVDGDISFECSVTDVEGLKNISLWHNQSGNWRRENSTLVSGFSDTVQFNNTGWADGGYIWNCRAEDIYNASDWGNTNYTVYVDASANQVPVPDQDNPEDDYFDNDGDINFTCSATDVEGLSEIRFYWNISGGWELNGTVSVTGTSNSTIFQRFNLDEDKNTKWACGALDDFGQLVLTTNRTFTVDTTPPTLELYRPSNNTNITGWSVSFYFNASDTLAPILDCNITIDNIDNLTQQKVNSGENSSRNVTGFENGLHNWTVTCQDYANNTVTANYRNFTIYNVETPLNVEAYHAPDNNSIIVNWSGVGAAQSYNIYISTNYSDGFKSIPNITGITTHNYTDANAEDSRKRFYQVAAVNGPSVNISTQHVGKVGKEKLNTGFFLTSLPLIIPNFEINNGTNNAFIFDTQPLDCIANIFRWNGTSFEQTSNENNQAFIPAIGSESFTSLEAGRSYWMDINQTCNLTYVGEVPKTTFDITMDHEFYLAGWYSVIDKELGEDAVVGDNIDDTPAGSITRIYRYNTTSGLFEGTRYFGNYGWWPFFDDQEFTTIGSAKGYYFNLNPSVNWTFNPIG